MVIDNSRWVFLSFSTFLGTPQKTCFVWNQNQNAETKIVRGRPMSRRMRCQIMSTHDVSWRYQHPHYDQGFQLGFQFHHSIWFGSQSYNRTTQNIRCFARICHFEWSPGLDFWIFLVFLQTLGSWSEGFVLWSPLRTQCDENMMFLFADCVCLFWDTRRDPFVLTKQVEILVEIKSCLTSRHSCFERHHACTKTAMCKATLTRKALPRHPNKLRVPCKGLIYDW